MLPDYVLWKPLLWIFSDSSSFQVATSATPCEWYVIYFCNSEEHQLDSAEETFLSKLLFNQQFILAFGDAYDGLLLEFESWYQC